MYRLLALISFGASVAWMYTTPSYEPFIAIVATVAALLKDEIHGFIGAKRFSLNPRRGVIGNLKHYRYSFINDEFINPLIIRDLYGLISDIGDQVVSINISGSNKSNRYYADQIESHGDKRAPIVSAKDGERRFSYQYLGRSYSGMHLLHISDYGEGSGVFGAIMFVTLSLDIAMDLYPKDTKCIDRLIIKKVGSLPLGDRYDGKIWFKYGLLYIGASNRHESLRKLSQWLIVI